jgi:hypothetical protein
MGIGRIFCLRRRVCVLSFWCLGLALSWLLFDFWLIMAFKYYDLQNNLLTCKTNKQFPKCSFKPKQTINFPIIFKNQRTHLSNNKKLSGAGLEL